MLNYLQVNATKVQVDAIKIQVNAIKVQIDATKVQVDATKVQVDAIKVQVDATKVQVDASKVQVIRTCVYTVANIERGTGKEYFSEFGCGLNKIVPVPNSTQTNYTNSKFKIQNSKLRKPDRTKVCPYVS
ncbi:MULTISPECIES: hypothetical protein, partial [unclassified Nostoc]|uniref:hypothetical protein n=1 Tax=unclassified Nostoc TaxID=2593658 RepID=UPI003919D570